MLIKKGGGGVLDASGLSLRLGKCPRTSVAAHRALPSAVCIPRLPDDDSKRVNPNRRPIGIPDERQDNGAPVAPGRRATCIINDPHRTNAGGA